MSIKPNDETNNERIDWAYWNRMPVLELEQAILLTINFRPRKASENLFRYTNYEGLYPSDYHELKAIAQAHILNRSLKYLNPGAGLRPDAKKLQAVDWLQWLRTIDVSAPDEWQPFDTATAAKKGGAVQVTDEAIIDAIADDIYNRMDEINDDISRVGGQKIYNFLSTEPIAELAAKYQLPVMSYWLLDEKRDSRDPLDIGKKIGLSSVKIQYERKDADEHGSVPFRNVWEAFNQIKSR